MTATNKNILCDLSHLGLLQVSGADAVSFLQGQVTNDVNLLTGTNAHYTAYCNPKGRMLALFLAYHLLHVAANLYQTFTIKAIIGAAWRSFNCVLRNISYDANFTLSQAGYYRANNRF